VGQRNGIAWGLLVGLVVMTQPVTAQTVAAQRFVFMDSNGNQVVEDTTRLPLIPHACYTWGLNVATKNVIKVFETFTMPTAPGSWRPENASITSADGRSVTNPLKLTPVDGWIEHTWCMEEDDPLGSYLIEVKSGERVLGTFPFQVEVR
jgi:hypothetical protein